MAFSIIAAVDAQRGIGFKGGLPWRLRGDMQHFKELTVGSEDQGRPNAVIMGKITWLSLPEKFRPLPDRLNIVLDHEKKLEVPSGVLLAINFDQALELAQHQAAKIFIIGGGAVYRQAISHPECDTVYLTEIRHTFECDTFFPPLPPEFQAQERSQENEENGIKYSFVTYKRASVKLE